MSLQQQLLLAGVATLALVALRLGRVRGGRTPFPAGHGRRLLIVAFLIVPPLALDWLIDPAARTSPLLAVPAVPPYLVILAALTLLMAVVVRIDQLVLPGRPHRLLRVALLGSEPDPADMTFDPPLRGELAQTVTRVEHSNAVFPRGAAFPTQIDRADFHEAWDTLDADTAALERRIADDHRLGLPVASAATAVAWDARNRLETLRHLALDHGQAWAAG